MSAAKWIVLRLISINLVHLFLIPIPETGGPLSPSVSQDVISTTGEKKENPKPLVPTSTALISGTQSLCVQNLRHSCRFSAAAAAANRKGGKRKLTFKSSLTRRLVHPQKKMSGS